MIVGGGLLMGASSVTGDPLGTSVKMLLHGDGADGSTTAVDSSLQPTSFTAHGGARVSSAQYKYGSASLSFGGNGDWFSAAPASALAFAAASFTVECWYRKSGNGVNGYDTIVSTAVNGNGGAGWYLELSTTRGMMFRIGANSYTNTTTSWINDSTWHHLAIVRDGTAISFFIDGISRGLSTATCTDSVGAAGTLLVGAGPNSIGTPTWFFNGFIDDLRISAGVARYTGPFTPPVAQLPNP
jgi:hypothetical protein